MSRRSPVIFVILSLAASAAIATQFHYSDPAKAEPIPMKESQAWKARSGLLAQAKETCFLKGEKTDGMNKICFYDCPSGAAAITVGAASLCPLTIKK